MALKFYYAPMSTASLTSVALAELEIPVEKIKLDLKAGDTKKPDYLAINPNGKVPAIVDDGVPMFESLAILIHLGDKYGVSKGLWPAMGTPERARALTWATWTSVSLTGAGYALMMSADKTPSNPGHAEFDKLLGILDGHLTRQRFVTGDKYSLADSHAALTLGWLKGVLKVDLAKFSHLEKWMKLCEERPAFRAAE